MKTYNLALNFQNCATIFVVCHSDEELNLDHIRDVVQTCLGSCFEERLSAIDIANRVCDEIRQNCDCTAFLIKANAVINLHAASRLERETE